MWVLTLHFPRVHLSYNDQLVGIKFGSTPEKLKNFNDVQVIKNNFFCAYKNESFEIQTEFSELQLG